jgi:hypothetical protein
MRWKTATRRYWWRAALTSTKRTTMPRPMNRTSTAPMALLYRRLRLADAGLAGRVDRVGLAATDVLVDGGGVAGADGVLAGPAGLAAVECRAAAVIAKLV